jgi:hypothetical protein
MEIADPRVDPKLVPVGSVPRVFNGPDNEYRDLPSVRTPNGYVITRWNLTDEERARVAAGDDVFVTLVSSNGKINPLFVTIGPVDWTQTPA